VSFSAPSGQPPHLGNIMSCKCNKNKGVKMIVISLLSSGCCGSGMVFANKLYETFEKNKIDVSMMGFNSVDEGNTLYMKYKVKKEDLPVIVLDELGLMFKAEQVKDEKFVANLLKTINPKPEIVTK
jgi:hypothetical protein